MSVCAFRQEISSFFSEVLYFQYTLESLSSLKKFKYSSVHNRMKADNMLPIDISNYHRLSTYVS